MFRACSCYRCSWHSRNPCPPRSYRPSQGNSGPELKACQARCKDRRPTLHRRQPRLPDSSRARQIGLPHGSLRTLGLRHLSRYAEVPGRQWLADQTGPRLSRHHQAGPWPGSRSCPRNSDLGHYRIRFSYFSRFRLAVTDSFVTRKEDSSSPLFVVYVSQILSSFAEPGSPASVFLLAGVGWRRTCFCLLLLLRLAHQN